MKKLLSFTPWLLAALMACGIAHAEKADSAKPMNIEADTLRHDDLKQTSVFTGNVVMTKGSIILRGAQLEVRQDPQGCLVDTSGAADASPRGRSQRSRRIL